MVGLYSMAIDVRIKGSLDSFSSLIAVIHMTSPQLFLDYRVSGYAIHFRTIVFIAVDY